MQREQMVADFSKRLVAVMQQAGMHSSRSKAGVTINKLAEIASCSLQMARRYTLGEALPDVYTLYNIAKWLHVSAGWLLFGEETQHLNDIDCQNLVQIDSELLKYILSNAFTLFNISPNFNELTNFIMDIINDATHIEADRKAILKMIDISIHSVKRFNGLNNEQQTHPA